MNEILILEPNKRHYGYQESEDTEFFWLHWYSDTNVLSGIKHIRPENSYSISLYFRQLMDARVTQKSGEILDYLTRLILAEVYYNRKQMNVNPNAEKIAAWIKANNNSSLTVSHIAERFGYNVDYLNRLFKNNFSKGIKQYINEERLKYIKKLMLSEHLSLKEVALRAGFEDYKYFLKFFKYHEGITPTEYEKQFAKIYINSR